MGIGVGGWLCGHPVGFDVFSFSRPGTGPNLSRMVWRRLLVASLWLIILSTVDSRVERRSLGIGWSSLISDWGMWAE